MSIPRMTVLSLLPLWRKTEGVEQSEGAAPSYVHILGSPRLSVLISRRAKRRGPYCAYIVHDQRRDGSKVSPQTVIYKSGRLSRIWRSSRYVESGAQTRPRVVFEKGSCCRITTRCHMIHLLPHLRVGTRIIRGRLPSYHC